MKNKYAHSLRAALLLLALGSAHAASAQYVFTDANLGPYQQNFNSLPDTVAFAYGTSALPSMQGVYAEVQADAQFGSGSLFPWTVTANDGSKTGGNFYHFGQAGETDRAFGGIAETGLYTGLGYVGIRLKNNSSAVIQNLEIQYAMEQWYNSGNAEAAYVHVSYRKSSGAIGENFASLSSLAVGNAWTPIPALTVQAPSTGTVIQNRDGNSAANRRVVQTTLTDLNLAVGQEIMIRWDYVLNPTTNGNGVSIDDVVITPQTSVYFAQGSVFSNRSATAGAVTSNLVWKDAAGLPPADLSAPNRTYYISGAVNAADLAAVSGANSKIIVGTPALNGEPAQPGYLWLTDNTQLAVPIDVAAGSTLRIGEGATATPFTLGVLAPSSKVLYESTTATHSIQAGSYGELILVGAGPKVLAGNVTLQGNLQLSDAKLTLGAYDATILKGQQVVGAGPSTYVVTEGLGRLRQSVLADNAEVEFPVGNATDYQPITLRQSAFRSEDVFAVRVANEKFAAYGADETGVGAPLQVEKGVGHTWFVSEEVAGNIDLTLKAQWNVSQQSADFEPAKAFLSHYHNGEWDRTAAVGATLAAPDTYTVTRNAITSLSPFSVSSDVARTLPVELVSFTASRLNNVVNCTWTTASERQNAFFALERSLDGASYRTLGTVKGVGTSSSAHTYSLPDRQPVAQLAYYRLRQVDTDGKTSYSSVVPVKGSLTAASVEVLPNPSTGAATLRISGETGAVIHGSVVNALGAEVLRFSHTPQTDSQQQLPIDLSAQPAGVYFVKVQTPSGLQTRRLVKL